MSLYTVASFLDSLLDALAPPSCCLCRGPPGALPWLCGACAAKLVLFSSERCFRCGAPRPLPAPLCGACPDWPRVLVAARAACPHAGTARRLVHALKFQGNLAAARPLAALAAAAARDLPVPAGCVVAPVPLCGSRRRTRGFNQAEEIARPLARALGLRVRARLVRRVRTGTRATHRTPAGRRREVAGAFRAREGARGRAVLLVDDVLTTGATLGACARALARRGAKEVYAVTATRAPT